MLSNSPGTSENPKIIGDFSTKKPLLPEHPVKVKLDTLLKLVSGLRIRVVFSRCGLMFDKE